MFDLAPAETNPTEDFSAYWVQIEIDPGPGWCAKEVFFEMDAPDENRIVSAAPRRGSRTQEARSDTSALIVDGDGAAPVPGLVEQDVVVPPGRTSVRIDPDRYRFRWTGNSRRKVMFALGIQLANPSAPPELFYSWSEGQGMGMGSCRPYYLTIVTRRGS